MGLNNFTNYKDLIVELRLILIAPKIVQFCFHIKKYKILNYKKFIRTLINLIVLQAISFTFLPKKNLLASENFKNILSTKINDEPFTLKSNYLVGPGDTLKIEIIGVPELSGIFTINSEGELILPELLKVDIGQRTLEELTSYLTLLYKEVLYDPVISISISAYRPINIYVRGEVRQPGLYTLNTSSPGEVGDNINTIIFNSPRVFDALKIAKGINNNADLSSIKITRINSKSQGGGKITTTLDLLKLFENGDQSQNIKLHDGDFIDVPKSSMIIKEQILSIAKSNLSPATISVFVSGNVVNPGILNLKRGSSLNQAIASSGGKNILTGKVEFIRLNDDGSSIRNRFKFDSTAPLNSYKNPILTDGDVINVSKSFLGKTTELLGEISSPVFSGYGLYSIISDN